VIGPHVTSQSEQMLIKALEDRIYGSPTWLSSSVVVLAGIVASGLILVVVTRLVKHETRHSA
jgi:hypothetical protein